MTNVGISHTSAVIFILSPKLLGFLHLRACSFVTGCNCERNPLGSWLTFSERASLSGFFPFLLCLVMRLRCRDQPHETARVCACSSLRRVWLSAAPRTAVPRLRCPGVSQARILEWAALPSPGIFPPQGSNPCLCVSSIGTQIRYRWVTWETHEKAYLSKKQDPRLFGTRAQSFLSEYFQTTGVKRPPAPAWNHILKSKDSGDRQEMFLPISVKDLGWGNWKGPFLLCFSKRRTTDCGELFLKDTPSDHHKKKEKEKERKINIRGWKKIEENRN